MNSDSVMDSTVFNSVKFKSLSFKLVGDPVEWAGGISTGEDVAVHEESPDEVLEMPDSSETGDLEVEDSLLLEEKFNLGKELGVVLDSDVLAHLKTGDDVVLVGGWDISVVHAEEVNLIRNSVFLGGFFPPNNLLLGEGDSSGGGSVVLGGVADEGSPTASDIEVLLSLLHLGVLADEVQLSGLSLL